MISNQELFDLFKDHAKENREDNSKLYELNAQTLSLLTEIKQSVIIKDTKIALLEQSLAATIKDVNNLKLEAAHIPALKTSIEAIDLVTERIGERLNVLNTETELTRIASKYPFLTKMFFVGILVTVIISFGSLYSMYNTYSKSKKQDSQFTTTGPK